ncbi:MAG: hypothetical protein FJ313_04415, partial [Gemmatimonadetes bacterium]|nr:hypothetical protein [Gemmatimonadota bacterium]
SGVAVLLVCAGAAFGAEKGVVAPADAKIVGPYSPGILAGDYLYVSGQGDPTPDPRNAPPFEVKVRRTLENVKAIVEAAGLTMEHVVYTQVYLEDMGGYETMDRVWKEFFGKSPPAWAVLGVARMPVGTPVEVTAVALRDLAKKEPAGEGGVLTHDRLYIPGILAADTETALERLGSLLKAAGLDFRHVVFLNVYLDEKIPIAEMNKPYAQRFEFGNTPARATIKVASLPPGGHIEITGVAVRDLNQRRAVHPKNMPPSATASPCVLAGETLFCSAKSAFIPGPQSGIYADNVEHQVRQSLRNLLDGLEEAGMDLPQVVATNVYLDDIEEFAGMNRVYGSYFAGAPPTRTTVQPLKPVERNKDERDRWPMLEQISLIAVK